MKPILRLYIKAFLVMGITYASLMIIAGWIDGESFSLFKFLFHTIVFGGTMSLTLVSIHRSELSNLGVSDPNEAELKSIQSTEFISTVGRDEFITRLSSDKIPSRLKLEMDGDILRLTAGVTWKSWGESITIRISSTTEGMFLYQVQSKSKLPITIVDFGRNYENVMMIKRLGYDR